MYRRAEFGLFTVLSWTAICFALLSLGLTAAFFTTNSILLRNLSLVFVLFSFFFEVQIFMYKITVLEKRMLYLVGLSEQHFRIAKKRDHLYLIMYFILFWSAMMALVFAFTPKV